MEHLKDILMKQLDNCTQGQLVDMWNTFELGSTIYPNDIRTWDGACVDNLWDFIESVENGTISSLDSYVIMGDILKTSDDIDDLGCDLEILADYLLGHNKDTVVRGFARAYNLTVDFDISQRLSNIMKDLDSCIHTLGKGTLNEISNVAEQIQCVNIALEEIIELLQLQQRESE